MIARQASTDHQTVVGIAALRTPDGASETRGILVHRPRRRRGECEAAAFQIPLRPVDATAVIEALIVVIALGGVVSLSALAPIVPFQIWLTAGAGCTAAGLLLGVPTGFWYHVRLRAQLAPRGLLPTRWWLHPVALHVHLAPRERVGVLGWFIAGGIGFVLCVIGIALVVGASRSSGCAAARRAELRQVPVHRADRVSIIGRCERPPPTDCLDRFR